jgi:serine/threonine protein phosphatase 1
MKIDLTDRRNIYFVGDLHGDWDALNFFLDEVQFSYRDAITSVGDLIDRGPKPIEVVSFFLWTENAYAVRGNHEDMAIRGVLHGDSAQMAGWIQNGGDWMMGYPDQMLAGMLRELEKLPIAMEVQFENTRFGVTHAECPTNSWKDYFNQAGGYYPWDNKAIWGRSAIKGNSHKFIEDITYTIHGHSVRSGVTEFGNQLWIDTGSVFDTGSGKYGLTILEYDKRSKHFITHRIVRDIFESSGFRHVIK